MSRDILGRHVSEQLFDITLEGSRMSFVRLSELHRHTSPSEALLALDLGNFHLDPGSESADGDIPPASFEVFQDVDMPAAALRTDELLARCLDAERHLTSGIFRGPIPIASNPEHAI